MCVCPPVGPVYYLVPGMVFINSRTVYILEGSFGFAATRSSGGWGGGGGRENIACFVLSEATFGTAATDLGSYFSVAGRKREGRGGGSGA